MTLGKKTLALLVSYLATIGILLPLVVSVIYLLSLAPALPKWASYLAVALCTLAGVGILGWFRTWIERRMR